MQFDLLIYDNAIRYFSLEYFRGLGSADIVAKFYLGSVSLSVIQLVDFATSDEELTLIFDEFFRETNEFSGKYSDKVKDVRRRKIRITESDSEVESDVE